MAQPLTIATITISEGDFLSTILDATDGDVMRIIMPDEWTPANLSFRVSHSQSSADFRDLYTSHGDEVQIPCVPRACFALGDESKTATRGSFIRFRSGPSRSPIKQAALRMFTIVIGRAVALAETQPAARV